MFPVTLEYADGSAGLVAPVAASCAIKWTTACNMKVEGEDCYSGHKDVRANRVVAMVKVTTSIAATARTQQKCHMASIMRMDTSMGKASTRANVMMKHQGEGYADG